MKSNKGKSIIHLIFFMMLAIFTVLLTTLFSQAEAQAAGGTITAAFFEDTNGDGLQDLGEEGVSGIRVEIFSGYTGESLGLQETGSDGRYTFSNLEEGEYYLQLKTMAPEFELYTNIGFKGGFSDYYEVFTDKTTIGPHAGLISLKGAIKGIVFEDKNKDGINSSEDLGIENVSVKIKDEKQVVINQTKTDANGNYTFSKLKSQKNYFVEVDYPKEYELVPTNYFINSNTSKAIFVESKAIVSGVNLGLYKEILPTSIQVVPNEIKAFVGDTGKFTITILPIDTTNKKVTYTSGNIDILSVDENGNWTAKAAGMTKIVVKTANGLLKEVPVTVEKVTNINQSSISGAMLDMGNQGIENVTVKLYLYTGELVSKVKTNTDGSYRFDKLARGTYYLEIEDKEGYQIVYKSNERFWGSQTGYIDVNGLDNYPDFKGYMSRDQKQSAISGKITNLDDGAGFSRIQLTLFDARTDKKMTEIATSEDGTYQFSGLGNGVYYIKMTLPIGYVISKSTVFWGDATGWLTLDGANRLDEQDASLSLKNKNQSSISGKLLNKDTGSGFYRVKVSLYEAYTGKLLEETSTAEDGSYNFSKLGSNVYYMKLAVPKDYRIVESEAFWGDSTGWLTLNGTDTLDNQDAILKKINNLGSVISGEITGSAEAIKVSLFNAETGEKLSETSTTGTGSYKFDSLAKGSYYLTATMPKGYAIESTNSFWGDATGWLTVDGTSQITNLYTRLKLINQSVIQGKMTNEKTGAGIPAITLSIHNSSNGQKLSETITKEDGTYEFSNLVAGNYYLMLHLPENYSVVSGSFTNLITKTLGIDGTNRITQVDAQLSYEILPQSIVVKPNRIDTIVGDTGQLTVEFTPNNVTDKTVTYHSNDQTILTIDSNGQYVAKKVGTTTITVTTKNNKSVDVPVTVRTNNIPVTGISVSPSKLDQFVGDTGQLLTTVIPSNATNQKGIFNSLDKSVITVDASGRWHAVGVGVTVITVNIESITQYVVVTVKEKEIPVTGIELISPMFTNTKVNVTGKINAKVQPNNATAQELIYESEDSSMLTVDASGNWKALKEGSLRVKITSKNGLVSYASFAISSSDFE